MEKNEHIVVATDGHRFSRDIDDIYPTWRAFSSGSFELYMDDRTTIYVSTIGRAVWKDEGRRLPTEEERKLYQRYKKAWKLMNR